MTTSLNVHVDKSDVWVCKLTKEPHIVYATIALQQADQSDDLTIFVQPNNFDSIKQLRDKLTQLLKAIKEFNL